MISIRLVEFSGYGSWSVLSRRIICGTPDVHLHSGARWFGFAGWNWQHTRHHLMYSATCLSVS